TWRKKGILLLTAALALCMCGCGEPQAGQETVEVKTVSVNPLQQQQTVTASLKDVKKREIYEGIISPYVEELSFAQDGIFLEYCVKLGDTVSKGDTLAVTDTSAYQKQAESLQKQIEELTRKYLYEIATRDNSLKIYELELEETYKLIDLTEYLQDNYTQLCIQAGNLVSSMDRLELEKKHLTENYELELPYLQEQLSDCQNKLKSNVIKAPFDGTVVDLQPGVSGDRVDKETPMIALADTTRYLAVGTYVTSFAAERAERIYVFLDGEEYEAEYIPMDKKVYSALMAKRLTPYSSFELYPQEPLEFGHMVRIVVQQESRQQVLTVPGLAVQQDGSRKYCYRKVGEGREKVYLETGLYDGLNYEVLSGLQEGDEVYID
ncbi:MAG: efflux RND transporter periplasmic adaptor subunit, partial [Acetatifactor sp.]|nr:efflux RND transporter periplasmic adaptor subunit [Acetatifactor sp.]